MDNERSSSWHDDYYTASDEQPAAGAQEAGRDEAEAPTGEERVAEARAGAQEAAEAPAGEQQAVETPPQEEDAGPASQPVTERGLATTTSARSEVAATAPSVGSRVERYHGGKDNGDDGGGGGDDGSGSGGGALHGLPVIPMLVALIGAFMGVLDASIVNVAIPHIMADFGAATKDVQWIVTIYMLAMGVVVPFSGWLSDRFGTRRIYIFALVVFTIGSFLSGMSWSVTSLSGARVIQAIGGGLLQPVVMAMMLRMVPRDRMGSAMGIFGMAIVLAPAIGPTLGGYLTEYFSWRWIFMINVPVGIIGVTGALTLLPDFKSKRDVASVDFVGGLFVAGFLFSLLLALTKGQSWGWGSERIVYLFYFAGVLMLAFVWWELRQKAPVIDLRVLKFGTFSLSLLTSAVLSIGLYAGLFYVPLFLQNIRGLSAVQTGLLIMPSAVVSGIFMPIGGRLFDKVGPRPVIITGISILALATWFLHHLSINTPVYLIAVWMMIRGAGMGLTMMPSMTAGMSVLPEEFVNVGSGVQNIIQRVSSAFGIAILTAVLTTRKDVHYASLRAGLTANNWGFQHLLQQIPGAGQASMQQIMAQWLPRLRGLALQRASVSAMDDLFVITAVITALAILPVFFLRARFGEDASSGAPVMME